MKFEQSEVVLRFMTMREPSKPITIHSAIKVADLISSHHVPSSGEILINARSLWGTMLWPLILDGRCADTAVRTGRISFTKKNKNALKSGKSSWTCEGEDKFSQCQCFQPIQKSLTMH